MFADRPATGLGSCTCKCAWGILLAHRMVCLRGSTKHNVLLFCGQAVTEVFVVLPILQQQPTWLLLAVLFIGIHTNTM